MIGAGQMGNGIAHVCALAGFMCCSTTSSPSALPKGIATISGNMSRQVSRQRISDEEREAALKRISAGARRSTSSATAIW